MLKGQNGITHHVLSQRKLQHRSADDSRESMLRVNAGQTMKWWAWRQWHVGFAFCPSLGEDAEVEFHLRIWCRPAFSILSRLELPSFDPCVSNLSICKLTRQQLGAAWRTHLEGLANPWHLHWLKDTAGRGVDMILQPRGRKLMANCVKCFFWALRREWKGLKTLVGSAA